MMNSCRGGMRILGLLLCALWLSPAAARSDPLRAGFILPLTGNAASWGIHARNGAILAREELPPRLQAKLRLEFEDDRFQSAAALSAFRALTRSPLDLAVMLGSQASSAVLPLSEQRGATTITITALAAGAGRQHAFSLWLCSQAQAELLVRTIRGQGRGRLALFAASHEAQLDLMKKVAAETRRSGLGIALQKEFLPDETDFRTSLLQLRDAGADAIVIGLLPGQTAAFLKQRLQLAPAVPVFGTSAVENSGVLSASGVAMEGLQYAGPFFRTAFVQAFSARFGEQPELAAGAAYDIVTLLADAARAGVAGGPSLTAFLRNRRSFSGAIGSYVLTPDNAFCAAPVLKEVRGGVFKIASPNR